MLLDTKAEPKVVKFLLIRLFGSLKIFHPPNGASKAEPSVVCFTYFIFVYETYCTFKLQTEISLFEALKMC